MFMSKRINPSTKHKTKSNSLNKFESEQANMKKKKKKGRFDLSQSVGRTTRGGGDACDGGPSPSLSLSLSLSLSDVKRWNDLEVKKKIKRRGLCVLCGGEKQVKEKRKKEMKHG